MILRTLCLGAMGLAALSTNAWAQETTAPERKNPTPTVENGLGLGLGLGLAVQLGRNAVDNASIDANNIVRVTKESDGHVGFALEAPLPLPPQ